LRCDYPVGPAKHNQFSKYQKHGIFCFMPGIERAPIAELSAERPTQRQRDASAVFSLIGAHIELIEDYLGIGTAEPFIVDDEALAVRQAQLEFSKQASHHTERGIQEIAVQLGATVKQVEAEMNRATLLDIGCGNGQFGAQLSRSAKAKVTFLERDKDVLPAPLKNTRRQVQAHGESLPFKDESFDKTTSNFSALSWADSPLSALSSLQESLRVTDVGGTHIAVPIMSQVLQRQGLAKLHMRPETVDTDPDPTEDPRAFKVWALQDYLLLTTLLELEHEGVCSTTWTSLIGNGGSTGQQIESYSAIVDKKEPIPQQLLDSQTEYAQSFFAEQ
jgi:ubiquinone/menaquinone biosynthesis C-methylase UbiE